MKKIALILLAVLVTSILGFFAGAWFSTLSEPEMIRFGGDSRVWVEKRRVLSWGAVLVYQEDKERIPEDRFLFLKDRQLREALLQQCNIKLEERGNIFATLRADEKLKECEAFKEARRPPKRKYIHLPKVRTEYRSCAVRRHIECEPWAAK